MNPIEPIKLNKKTQKISLVEWVDNQKLKLRGSMRLRIAADRKFIPNAIWTGFTFLNLTLDKNMLVEAIKIGTNRPVRNQIFKNALLFAFPGKTKYTIAAKPRITPNNLNNSICSILSIKAIM